MSRQNRFLLPEVEIPGSSVNPWGRTIILDDETILRLNINYPDPAPQDQVWLMINDKVVWTITLTNSNQVPLMVELDPPHLKCCWQNVRYRVFSPSTGSSADSEQLNLLKKKT
ncbi:hypothetical protein [Pseudomonas orientalis]|uniref:hypothetical protein n=1 Tax=Pseudomonas orientalis TaxID=76758 RepID=UPI000F067219